MQELIGHKVDEVWVQAGEEAIFFLADGVWFTWYAWGDCCSESWFADIIGFNNLLGRVVTDVQDLELPDTDQSRTRQESDQVYGIQLTTDMGHVTIAYRNSSNGYYGGELSRCTHEAPKPDDRRITEDWSA